MCRIKRSGSGPRLPGPCWCRLWACSVITTSLYRLGVMPGGEMPSVCHALISLPQKLIHYALFICLPIHTYVRTHGAASWLPSRARVCVYFFSSSLPLLWFDMISFFICLKSICNPMQELIPLHTPDTHTHTHSPFVNLFGLCNTSGQRTTDPDWLGAL